MSRRIFLAAVVCLAGWIATPVGQEPAPAAGAVEGEIIVKFRPSATASRRDAALAAIGGQRIKKFETIDIDHVRLPRGRKAADAIAGLLASGAVLSAQPNYIRHTTQSPPPNDFFWVNRAAYGFYGMEKIQANQVWSTYTTGSTAVVVADIDTGVKYDHPDLIANMWVNPGEVAGDGLDNDVNGYVDDVHGINALTHTGNPMDDNGHGTHTAGTFGAVGNNGIGVVGVNWTVKILACKFLNAAGGGSDAGAIECLNYITMMKARGNNIRVSSNSWGSERGAGPFPQSLKDAIDAAGSAGILNVFAAGNGGADGIGDNIDTTPTDPASFDSPSIVSVAASDDADGLAGFSNYGPTSVDLAAPGVSIVSTWIDETNCIDCYAWLHGTSMATPHVAGAAALLAALSPAYPASALKSLLIDNVDPVAAWGGLVASGGRLNVFNAAVVVATNTAPAVTITSPSQGAQFPVPGLFTFSADATDLGGTVAKVDFYSNGNLIATDNASPFSIGVGLSAGSYTLTAEATDNLGAVGASPPVTITVTSTPAPPLATLSPSSLMFGKQLVGTTSAASQSVSFTNQGPSPLVFNTFDGATPASTFSVGTAGNFQGQTTCPLGSAGLAANASCLFTFQSSPTVTGPHSANFSIATNASSSPHSIFLSGTGFIVDEATVVQAITSGGARLQNLQNPVDGGWNFNVASPDCGLGPGVSCPNIVGVTAIGLLKSFERNPLQTTLRDDAIQAGERLRQVYAPVTRGVPYSQDLEFLVALSEATADPQWAAMAQDWFLTVIATHGNGTAHVNSLLQTRGSLAAWDTASLIRSAKAVGQADYALAAAIRIRERQSDWIGVNQTHTDLGMGSLLWAWHDLAGFELQIASFRTQLLATQDPVTGAWDDGNLQATAYAVIGLAAVGGTGTDAAIRSAVAFYIANQLPLNGWPFVAGGVSEYSVVDGEVIRAIATLYSTPAGSSVQVAPAQLSRVTFDQVSTSGSTTVVALDRSTAGSVPFGYSLVSGLTYEVQSTAEASGSITVCLAVPWGSTAGAFNKLRILHAEHGAFFDRTIRVGAMAPDFGSKRVCAKVSSLDAFAVAIAADSTAPELGVTLSPAVLAPANNQLVTITATIAVSDNADSSPAITLVSITTGDGKHAKREDVQGAVIGTDDRTFSLRAERGERGAERVYTITYRATDRSWNTTEKSATVVVPGRK